MELMNPSKSLSSSSSASSPSALPHLMAKSVQVIHSAALLARLEERQKQSRQQSALCNAIDPHQDVTRRTAGNDGAAALTVPDCDGRKRHGPNPSNETATTRPLAARGPEGGPLGRGLAGGPLLATTVEPQPDPLQLPLTISAPLSPPSPSSIHDPHSAALPPLIILDLRPLHSFLQTRVVGSINLALPSLIVKRIKRTAGALGSTLGTAMKAAKAAGAASQPPSPMAGSPLLQLSTYITTAPGKRKFQNILDRTSSPVGGADGDSSSPASPKARRTAVGRAEVPAGVIRTLAQADVIVVCEDGNTVATSTAAAMDASNALCNAIVGLKSASPKSSGEVTLYTENLSGLASRIGAERWVEHGEESDFEYSRDKAERQGKAKAGLTSSTGIETLVPDFKTFSMGSPAPSLSSSHSGPNSPTQAGLKDSTSRLGGMPGAKRPGRPSLARINTSERFKTLSAISTPSSQTLPSATVTSINHNGSADSLRATLAGLSSSSEMSFQNLARLQSQAGPSAAGFGDMSLPMNLDNSAGPSTGLARVQQQYSQEISRVSSPSPLCVSLVDDSQPAFDVSEILPSFLYLGPDIATQEEVEELKARGVKAILNCAVEVSDKGGMSGHRRSEGESSPCKSSEASFDSGKESKHPASPHSLVLGEEFSYLKIPLYDNVEALDVLSHLKTGCQFLEEARGRGQPVYVHCRAGKSRSVTVVIAYLMKVKGWSLTEAYEYVKQRRKDVSPNIGFVSLLMEWQDQVAAAAAEGEKKEAQQPAGVGGVSSVKGGRT